MSSKIKNISFILLYISIWLSLDSSIYNLINITYDDFYNDIFKNRNTSGISNINYPLIFDIFISLRFTFPYLIFVILFILFRKDLFKISLDGNFRIVIYLIFFSFTLQTIIPFFSENSIFNITFTLTSLILLINLIYFYSYFDLKKIFLIGLIILFFITTVYGSVLIHHLIFNSPSLNLYGMWPENLAALQFLSNEVPRSSGISRSSLILMIPLGFYFLINEKINYKIYLIYLIYLFFTFLMLSTQSRITLFGYVLGVIVFSYYILFIYKFAKLKDKIKKYLTIIILPIIFWAFCLEILSSLKKTPAYIEYFSDKLNVISDKLNIKTNNNSVSDEDLEGKYIELFRPMDKKSFSSQRTKDWKNIIKKNDNYFLGYGAMGDRHLINQSASSLYFYNYASGGLLVVFFFLLLIFRSIYISTTSIFKIFKYPNKDNYLVLSAAFIIFFLVIRSIIESSFAVFGIDSLIFFSSYFYIEQCYKKNKI